MTSKDWTPEAAAAIELCTGWTRELTAEVPCEVYLFGSAIYESGEQFDAQQSDLDLAIVFADTLDATQRVIRLIALGQYKRLLELHMVPALKRVNCTEPGVSVVPITTVEVSANIHKSGSRRFFDRNIFLKLGTALESVGIPGAGTCSIAEEARQALEYVQKMRNQFLSVSANGTGGLADFDAADPLPKSLARVAAQLVPDAAIGTWYDTRFGLEFLCDELSRRRSESQSISELHRKISVRRGGRGRRLPLSAQDQLLLGEILFDRAASFPLDPTATWEIRFNGVSPHPAERERILQTLRGLAPDAQIMGNFEGSIIVRLRSSKRTYIMIKRLEQFGVLAKYFDIPEVKVAAFHDAGERPDFTPRGTLDRIAEQIKAWRPQSYASMATTESDLAHWLEVSLLKDPSFSQAMVARDALIGDTARPMRADILLEFPKFGRMAIELVRLRSRASFFQQIERLRRIALPAILVVLGTTEQLKGLEGDIRKLEAVEGALRVVPIEFNDE